MLKIQEIYYYVQYIVPVRRLKPPLGMSHEEQGLHATSIGLITPARSTYAQEGVAE